MEQTDQSLSTRDLASADSAPAVEGEPEQESRRVGDGDVEQGGGGGRAPAADGEPEQVSAMGDAAPADREPGIDDAAPYDREAGTAEAAQFDRDAGTAEATPTDQQVAPPPSREQLDTTERGAEQPGSESAGTSGTSPRSDGGAADGDGPLLSNELSSDFQGRWERIQTRFVDEPRGAVEEADALVANVMQKVAEEFATERERLEAHWDRGEDISTEDLRVALRRYRSFFQRLLSA